MVTTEAPTNTQHHGRAALAYASRGIPVLPCHWPTPQEFPQFCSCTDLDCPDPACHPIDAITTQATHDLSQLSRWWLAHPTANLATITDSEHVGVVELRHFVKPEHVLRLLNAYQIERGPLINAAPGRLQFLVRPDHAKLGSSAPEPIPGATLTTLPPGTLVLLPPSRLMSGFRLGWLRRLNHATQLPAATPFLAQLTDFVATGALDDPHPLLAT
jgi:hypothetical protein